METRKALETIARGSSTYRAGGGYVCDWCGGAANEAFPHPATCPRSIARAALEGEGAPMAPPDSSRPCTCREPQGPSLVNCWRCGGAIGGVTPAPAPPSDAGRCMHDGVRHLHDEIAADGSTTTVETCPACGAETARRKLLGVLPKPAGTGRTP